MAPPTFLNNIFPSTPNHLYSKENLVLPQLRNLSRENTNTFEYRSRMENTVKFKALLQRFRLVRSV